MMTAWPLRTSLARMIAYLSKKSGAENDTRPACEGQTACQCSERTAKKSARRKWVPPGAIEAVDCQAGYAAIICDGAAWPESRRPGPAAKGCRVRGQEFRVQSHPAAVP